MNKLMKKIVGFSSGLALLAGCSDNLTLNPNSSCRINSVQPNPVSSGLVIIDYNVDRVGNIEFDVLNVGGRIVDHFMDDTVLPGANRQDWYVSDLNSGKYTLRLKVDGENCDNYQVIKQ